MRQLANRTTNFYSVAHHNSYHQIKQKEKENIKYLIPANKISETNMKAHVIT